MIMAAMDACSFVNLAEYSVPGPGNTESVQNYEQEEKEQEQATRAYNVSSSWCTYLRSHDSQ